MVDVKMLSGLRLVVVGLAREGIALAGYLGRHNLAVTGTDLRSETALGPALDPLKKMGLPLVLGEHPLSLLDEADLLFVSPGVPLEAKFVQQAVARKIPLCTESKLFCYLCPAPVVAITGSSGKTTTTTLVGKIMEATGRKTWVGGNIGQPLIGEVDQIAPEDIVVMELSSFQLEYFHGRLNQDVDLAALPTSDPAALAGLLGDFSPQISAILNITPNHLDRHPTMKHYVRAKRAIINYQGKSGAVIMNLDNDMTRAIGNQFGAKVRWFSLEAQPPNGAGLVNDNLVLFDQDLNPQHLATKSAIKLRGAHNLANILAACLLAREAGAPVEAMQGVITSFTGVEHRLELVREYNEATYYNDSISTSPERLLAALHSFSEPMILLAGGRDKHLPWEEAAWLMLHKVRDVILFGESADLIAEFIEATRSHVPSAKTVVHRTADLAEAVSLAADLAKSGNVVLLSPGCASYDMFKDYVERGRQFKDLVNQL
ncbi:MAG: UDP-N-acetylmuramoyl-L-alanine--D-glutamate ligase [Anaerolineales bacterium]|nr:UDP-N-acetylmuramoyl-L-alanine--D-glutamate ligase [Anaerolineales bacterium]